uniref:Putative secreted protein n=1 Tax=Anopheles triannulatus TaxID=58253 RepID=A0A2M4B7Z7_9DIPT
MVLCVVLLSFRSSRASMHFQATIGMDGKRKQQERERADSISEKREGRSFCSFRSSFGPPVSNHDPDK